MFLYFRFYFESFQRFSSFSFLLFKTLKSFQAFWHFSGAVIRSEQLLLLLFISFKCDLNGFYFFRFLDRWIQGTLFLRGVHHTFWKTRTGTGTDTSSSSSSTFVWTLVVAMTTPHIGMRCGVTVEVWSRRTNKQANRSMSGCCCRGDPILHPPLVRVWSHQEP